MTKWANFAPLSALRLGRGGGGGSKIKTREWRWYWIEITTIPIYYLVKPQPREHNKWGDIFQNSKNILV